MSVDTPIAVVGMGCVFPGAFDVSTFWRNVVGRVDTCRDVPTGRWILDPDRAQAPAAAPDKVVSRRGCFVDPFELDLAGLDLDPALIRALDPLYHMVLHAGRDAWADAALTGVDRSRVGVILAAIALPTDGSSAITREILGRDFERRLFEAAGRRPPETSHAIHPLNARVTALPASLLTRALGLGGGSYTLDAACASSLYAAKLACDELRAGRLDAVLAGGVSRPDCLYTQMGFTQLRSLSPSGRCAPFDARADGLVVGEGAGIVVLRRLDDAIRDGCHIYGVIRGVGLSNDIGGSLLAPDSEGQLRAMREAYRRAGWSPESVDLIECHGTGTPTGDAVEIASLRALWKGATARPGQCAIGSVKSMIGHLLTGAGAAGLIKTLCALREGVLPPSLNFERPSAGMELDGSPFRVQAEAAEWRRPADRQGRAAVSAFGFGGINAHVLVEEYSDTKAGRPTGFQAALHAKGTKAKPETTLSSSPPVHRAFSSFPGSAGASPSQDREPIAIIGMDARFGTVDSLRAFQELVFNGRSAGRSRPAARWRGVEPASGNGPGDNGAYLEQLSIGVGEFRLPPNEIPELLPQQLVMMQSVAAAMRDAGMTQRTARPRVGAVLGIALDFETTDFHLRWWLPRQARIWAEALGLTLGAAELDQWIESLRDAIGPPLTAARTSGALGGMIASRIAREFSLGGPCFAVSAEEASGLRALEIAVRALQQGELDAAIVGAVDMAGDVRVVRMSAGQLGSEYVAGEGATSIVLKRLADAQREGDRVYAVVRGLSSASGGGIDRPTGADAIGRAIRGAHSDAAVASESIDYMECAGIDDCEAFLAEFMGCREPIALGAIESNVGRVGAAGGLAALVKAALSLYQKVVPAFPSGDHPDEEKSGPLSGPMRSNVAVTPREAGHSHILKNVRMSAGVEGGEAVDPTGDSSRVVLGSDWMHLPRRPVHWLRDRACGPRRAGVTVATHDGLCRYVVLEECTSTPLATLPDETRHAQRELERRQPLGARDSALFALGGSGAAEIRAELRGLARFVDGHEGGAERVARLWFAERGHVDSTQALVIHAATVDELKRSIEFGERALETHPAARIDGRNGVYFSPDPLGRRGEVAFVFPGSGNHYPGMGRDIATAWPEVLQRLDGQTERLASHLQPRLFTPYRADWSLGWEKEAEAAMDADPRGVIFVQVSHGVVMADLMRHFDVRPRAVIGYSLGESAGLFALRAWSDRDEMFRRMQASPLFARDLAGPCMALRAAWGIHADQDCDWHAVVMPRPPEAVRAALDGISHARLLIVNTPSECVVGGLRGDVDAVARRLGCRTVPLDGVPTVHFEAVREVEAAYRALHDLPTTPPPGIRFYSAVLGRAYEVNRVSAAESITGQALRGFDFPALIRQAYADGVRVFIELGPQVSCTRMIGRILGEQPHLARSACIRGEDQVETVLGLLAALIAERVPVDLATLYGGESVAVGHRAPVAESLTERRIIVPIGRAAPQPVLPKAHLRPTPDQSAGDNSVQVVERFKAAALIRTGHWPVPQEVATVAVPLMADSESREVVETLVPAMIRSAAATARAHETFLRLSQVATTSMGDALVLQAQLLGAALSEGRAIGTAAPLIRAATVRERSAFEGKSPPDENDRPLPNRDAPHGERPPLPYGRGSDPCAFTREQCLEFAIGRVANVLGPEFAIVDSHATRVRLPDEPLMLVDRILSVEGDKGSLTGGRLVTEHDVREGAWYLDGGRAPICITVEAGQADLFLSAYLGIDLVTKGLRTYRLLDATVTFHRGLPRPGETIRYAITIDRFVRRGDTYLFFFQFDGTIDDVPVLTMRNGCAGFFTPEEVAGAGGIVLKREDTESLPGRRDPTWRELVPMRRPSFDDGAVAALRGGDLAGCFGPEFANLRLRDPLRLPDGRMKLFDRVLELDPAGGRFGLGLIRAEADIHGDEWFLRCHFVDDMVMPGTLMYECCAHTLRFFLLRMGWVGEQAGVCYQPIPGVESALRCRGPVTPQTKKVLYQVEIKEIGYRPEPYVIADALMFADGARIVQMKDMSLMLTGLTRDDIESTWRRARDIRTATVRERPGALETESSGRETPPAPLIDYDRILAFAIGKPSDAFGEPYRVFDEQRRIARLPGPPFQFLDRIVEIEPEPWKVQPGGWIMAEYDVPRDAWYFRANRQRSMPFAVLLEAALQPCGWLAAYLGSALQSETDLRFRNLGGTATLHREIFPESGTLRTRVRMTNVSHAGGMIIEHFEFHMSCNGQPVYDGITQFGFFSEAALARQVGIREAKERAYRPSAIEKSTGPSFILEDVPPLQPGDRESAAALPAELPSRALRMVNRIDLLLPDGGPHGLGYIRGSTAVDPTAWFFKAHFFQDPVWPGSLGLESFLQLLKVYAVDRWGATHAATHRFEPILIGGEHEWTYRGQIVPTNRRVDVSAEVSQRQDGPSPAIVANGFLSVDGTVIYEMKDFGIRLVPDRY